MYPGLPWDLRHGGGRFLRNQTETAGGRGARIGKVGNAPAIEQRSKAEGELSADKKCPAGHGYASAQAESEHPGSRRIRSG